MIFNPNGSLFNDHLDHFSLDKHKQRVFLFKMGDVMQTEANSIRVSALN